MTTGRTLTVRPVSLRNEAGAEFVWTLDGTEVQRGTQSEYVFRAGGEPATHTLEAAMNKGGQSLRRQFAITVHPPKAGYRPATSASRAACNAVYAFLPAPGQFVQFGYSAATMEEACAHARKTLEDPEAGLSLGAFGGTLVVGFDHSIDRTEGYELAIQGNPFEGSSEPGIVWVMQDENGNGLPDDTWYELKGSAWDDPDVVRGYAVTYYRPSGPGTDVVWRDNRGGGGILPRLEFHTQDYFYPLWADDGGTSYTLRGTLLPDRAYDQSEGTGEEEYWVLPDFGWGYADNWSAEAMDPDHGNLFRIADAREVWQSFEELSRETDDACAKAAERIRERSEREPAKSRDERTLDERAEEARGASEALEAERATSRTLTKEPRLQEVRAK